MNLIRCRDCNGKVSVKATACPHCGAPVNTVAGTPVQTIEKTAKEFKKQLIIFVIMIVASTLWCVGTKFEEVFPLLLLALSVVGFICLRVQIWWHHG